MTLRFSAEDILAKSMSPHYDYCAGYGGQGGYVTALVMGNGAFPMTFSHEGSTVLDSTVAYDRAETDGAYLGQINMITVSSFCGPHGLIWGYDVARVELPEVTFLSSEERQQLRGASVFDGRRLRDAAGALFGTRDERRFPLCPGSHVPCAGKFRFFDGPCWIYAAVAIAIPEDRNSAAVLFMEDVGQLTLVNGAASLELVRHRILLSLARSAVEVGSNQRVCYEKIVIDLTFRQIQAGEVGCALVAMPYFHLAQAAYYDRLVSGSLKEWEDETRSSCAIAVAARRP